MKTYLQIHHLDTGDEEREILSYLESDGILPKYNLAGSTEDSNSILVYIGDYDKGSIEIDIKQIIQSLSDKTLNVVKNRCLNISVRIEISGNCAYFSPQLLQLIGEKGIQIYVSNWGDA